MLRLLLASLLALAPSVKALVVEHPCCANHLHVYVLDSIDWIVRSCSFLSSLSCHTHNSPTTPYPTTTTGRPQHSPQYSPAAFGPDLLSQGASLEGKPLVVVEPEDACGELSPSLDLRGKVALIRRGVCNFTDKCLRAQAHGAVAVVVYDSQDRERCVQVWREGNACVCRLALSVLGGEMHGLVCCV
jgi:hypothetical protein